MRISDETLEAAYPLRFRERRWDDESIRELVSFVVDREINYEAAGNQLGVLVQEGKLAIPATHEYLEWEWSRRIVNAALGIEEGNDG
jgi:hypothetical protein